MKFLINNKIHDMKIFLKYTSILFMFSSAVFITSCSNSPESVYKRMLNKYEKEKTGNISMMAEKFLMAFSGFQVAQDDIFFNKTLILSINGNNIKVIYPEKIKIDGDKSLAENIMFADINKNTVILGNNKGFCVFNKDGEPRSVYKADKKEKIDAIALKDKNVVYLTQGRIFEMSPADKKVKRMDPGEYHPPYKKFFRSSAVSTGKYFIFSTGIAGSYYISVFNAETGRSIMKNIAATSSEMNINDNHLWYVKGGTGTWSVERYEIQSKKRDRVKGVGKIDNIFMARDGFIAVTGKKLIIEDFNGEKGVMPQEWNILGTCRNTVLIEYGKVVYIIDFPVLLEKIKEFNKKTGEKIS
jgi:hypothetical protein